MKETIKAYRITLLVDEDTSMFLEKSYGYKEDNELWIWENAEEIEYERDYCDDCGSYTMMEDMACPYNEGYCLDCCHCDDGVH